jgi:hypothetical protein
LAGWSMVIVYLLACRSSYFSAMNAWPLYLFDNRYSFIDIHGPLKVYEVVVVYEVSYGVPMQLLALVGGLFTAVIDCGRVAYLTNSQGTCKLLGPLFSRRKRLLGRPK